MTTEITTIAFNLIKIIHSLTIDSPLKKDAKKELESAYLVLNKLKYENNVREGLNRVLTHLESAFTKYEPSNWDPFAHTDVVLWDGRTYKNKICITIAGIHYLLGNHKLASKWIDDHLSNLGDIEAPEGFLDLISMQNLEEFFKVIYNDNGNAYSSIKSNIEYNRYQANSDIGTYIGDSSFDYLP